MKLARVHKYHAKSIVVDGIRFASQKEARRYGELKLLAKAGEINSLALQPHFHAVINGIKVFKYIADFSYYTSDHKFVVEDVKGLKTPVYKLKKKIIEALQMIEITEI